MGEKAERLSRVKTRGARALNWAAFIVLFIFIGIAIIN
jgi:hypothetical protein